MKISFICNTIKPDFNLHNVIDSIHNTNLYDAEKEILIYSKENLNIPNTINYTFCCEPYNPRFGKYYDEGSVYGFNFLCSKSTGDFIVITTDDNKFCLDMRPVIDHFNNSDDEIVSVGDYAQTLEEIFPGVDFGDRYTNYSFKFANHPFFKRSFLKRTGGVIWNPNFYHHYVDNWLGFWLKSNYKEITTIPQCHVSYPEQHHSNSRYTSKDKRTMFDLVNNFIKNTEY